MWRWSTRPLGQRVLASRLTARGRLHAWQGTWDEWFEAFLDGSAPVPMAISSDVSSELERAGGVSDEERIRRLDDMLLLETDEEDGGEGEEGGR